MQKHFIFKCDLSYVKILNAFTSCTPILINSIILSRRRVKVMGKYLKGISKNLTYLMKCNVFRYLTMANSVNANADSANLQK
jgi:hypothetical protein